MAKAKKEKEVKNEEILETQVPVSETTETPVVDEGQPLIPEDFTAPKDENGDIIAADAGDTSGLLEGEEGAEGKTDTEIAAEEKTNGEISEELEGNEEKTPETSENEDNGEELIKDAENLLNNSGEIENALKNNEQEAAMNLLNTELEKANDIKAKLEADIEKREAEIKKKAIDKKKFQHTFGGFWNGVSSGWED